MCEWKLQKGADNIILQFYCIYNFIKSLITKAPSRAFGFKLFHDARGLWGIFGKVK